MAVSEGGQGRGVEPLPPDLRERLLAAGRALPCAPDLVASLAQEWGVGVAVSGGADSVALLASLAAEPSLAGKLTVFHFDHGVRGAAATADATRVVALASALGLRCEVGQRASCEPASETVLRAARHSWLSQALATQGIQVVCLGHHADDRTETLLLRLARGAGPEGLAAPRLEQRFRDGTRRVRPLLRRRRAELRAVLVAAGVPWSEDATNVLPGAPRNRVRLGALPALEAALGATWHEGVARAADNLAEAADALRVWLGELEALPKDGRSALAVLHGRPRALVRLACAEAAWAAGIEEVGGPAFEQLVDAVQAGRRARVELGGRSWSYDGDILQIEAAVLPGWGATLRPLPADDSAQPCGLRASRCDCDAAIWAKLSAGAIAPTHEVWLAVAPGATLVWRSRQPGDAYRPLGAPGVAKVADLLIDRKIPREIRENLPVVLINGNVAWVPGVPPSHELRLDGPCKGALRLTWQGPCSP